jgi:DNA-binding CsgD family transcriptional regulator
LSCSERRRDWIRRVLGSLTPRESRVAVLVVEGLSDRAIAEKLCLSRHTVSQHVKWIYRAPGIDSRVALTRLMLGAPVRVPRRQLLPRIRDLTRCPRVRACRAHCGLRASPGGRMKRFLVLYKGPPTPPDATHEGWPEWFDGIGDALVEVGSPMKDGVVLHPDGSTSDDATGLRGYGRIQAEDRREALALLRDHPLLSLGEWVIELFEVPRK